jgi:hypothetical protein
MANPSHFILKLGFLLHGLKSVQTLTTTSYETLRFKGQHTKAVVGMGQESFLNDLGTLEKGFFYNTKKLDPIASN